MLVLFVLGAAVCLGAVSGVDRAETSFNEADLPLNIGLPAPQRIQDARPVADPVAVLPAVPAYCTECLARSLVLEPAVFPSQHHGDSLQVLLCTFLI